MKSSRLVAIGALAVMACGVCSARDPYLGGTLISGRVQGNYLRAAPGVFIDAAIAPRSMQGEKWVDVAPRDGGAAVMARVPEHMSAEQGADVEVRIAHQKRPDLAPVGERTQVVTVNPPAAEPIGRRLAELGFTRRD